VGGVIWFAENERGMSKLWRYGLLTANIFPHSDVFNEWRGIVRNAHIKKARLQDIFINCNRAVVYFPI